MTWLKLSDGNNSYFQAIVRRNNKITDIHSLKDHEGRTLTEAKDMETRVLRFYKDLGGTANPSLLHIDIDVMRIGAQLQHHQSESLIALISNLEILTALKSIWENKVPGIDGYTSKFFKSSWFVIGVDIKASIHDFLDRNRMFRAGNCALTTIIPKTSNIKNMRDLKPIACSTTLYKIIYKILTYRLSKVISNVVDYIQSSLIRGKVI